ncbi:tetratricopeptide repeat protein [Pandoraea apista]|uniref:tetratricopeptide repeat protein n=1 Tax=Pandoraea apista TaxID=93218 RepID=UPI000AF45C82|nr:hypothetical protein [Pandoraea apista]
MPPLSVFSKYALGKLVDFLKPVVTAHGKVLLSERKAYSGAKGTSATTLRSSFESTYQRLIAESTQTSLVSTFVARTESKLVVPEFLRKDSVRQWLFNATVKEGLFTLAEDEYFNRYQNPSLFKQVTAHYESVTGEDSRHAEGATRSILAALVQGYDIRLNEQSHLIVDNVRIPLHGIQDAVDEIKARVSSGSTYSPGHLIGATESLTNNVVKGQLRQILLTRTFHPRTFVRISELAENVLSGNLSNASMDVKQEVLLWATRLLSNSPDTLNDAKKYFSQLTDREDSVDVQIASALLSLADGQNDLALRTLRDITTADGRTAFIFVLSKSGGQGAVVSWLKALPQTPLPAELNPTGWIALAVAHKETRQWEKAISLLEHARPLATGFPDLYFVEGMYRAAMLFPEEIRGDVIDAGMIYGDLPVMEGDLAESWRSSAIDALTSAQRELSTIDSERAEHALFHRIWLGLGSRDVVVFEHAKAELARLSIDLAGAVRTYPIARQFRISVDTTRLISYLDARLATGGLSEDEWIARLFLVIDTQQKSAWLPFLDSWGAELSKCFKASFLAGIRIEALLASNRQIARAKEELNARREHLPSTVVSQLEALIAQAGGEDVRPHLEALYRATPDLLNLANLASHLANVADFDALEPMAFELYRRDKSTRSAVFVVACLERPTRHAPGDMVTFLENAFDVIRYDDGLLSDLAWAQLQCGNWQRAKELNDDLLARHPEVERHIGLDINIAIKSGDWERFSTIFNREWARKESHSPRTLLLLAQLANEDGISVDRALELVTLAAETGDDDASILVSAFQAATQLGREDELSAGWLHRAAKSDDGGVVRHISMREIAEEVMPAIQRRSETVLESFRTSSVPIHLISSLLNLPLARLYCAIPSANRRQADSRKRTLLPFFGSREAHPLLGFNQNLGLDVTSILLLTTLGLLDITLSTFDSIWVAPDTLEVLLRESRRVKYQQPSLVRLAKDGLEALHRKVLRPTKAVYAPPTWLAAEVGVQLATLLEYARLANSKVITRLPVQRVGSFGEAHANLREYTQYVLPCKTYVDFLYSSGNISAAAQNHAIDILTKMGAAIESDFSYTQRQEEPVADDLAVRYLQRAEILAAIEQAGLHLQCSHDLEQELFGTLVESEEADRTVAAIESARKSLRRAMEAGSVRILAQEKSVEPIHSRDDVQLEKIPTLMAFLRTGHALDGLIIDDRYFTRGGQVVNEEGKAIFTHSTLNVIDALRAGGAITKHQWAEARHWLRTMGTTYVNVDASELSELVGSCVNTDDGQLEESLELKAFRQNLIHAISLDVDNLADRHILVSSYEALISIISEQFERDDFDEPKAVAITDWAIDAIARPLWTATSNGQIDRHAAAVSIVCATTVRLILLSALWEPSRRQCIHDALETHVFVPSASANPDVQTSVLAVIGDQLIELLRASSTAQGLPPREAGVFIASMPTRVQTHLIADTRFKEIADLIAVDTLTFFGKVSLPVRDLYNGLKAAIEQGDVEDANIRIKFANGELSLHLKDGDEWLPCDVHAFGGLLPDTELRVQAVANILREIGPAYKHAASIASSAERGPLSEADFSEILQACITGVKARWSRIRHGAGGETSMEALAPTEIEYYEAMLGPKPLPNDNVMGYIEKSLIPHRMALLQENLLDGLRIACMGFHHPLLAPSKLVAHVDNDALWDCVSVLSGAPDPLTKVSVVDICVRRSADPRFAELAKRTVERLCTDEMSEAIEFVAAAQFASVVHSETQRIHGAAEIPPFWRRMATWMQASVIVSCYQGKILHRDELCTWADSFRTPAAIYADIVDLYCEPFVAASFMSAETWSDLALNLLVNSLATADPSEFVTMLSAKVSPIASRRVKERPTAFASAGPCGQVEDRPPLELSDEQFTELADNLRNTPLSDAWGGLFSLSQIHALDRRIYATAIEGMGAVPIAESPIELESQLTNAVCASLVALVEADEVLAEQLRYFVVRAARKLKSINEVSLSIRALLISAGAFRDSKRRAGWFDDAAKTFCDIVPIGVPAAAAASILRDCSHVTKWHVGPANWAELRARSCS